MSRLPAPQSEDAPYPIPVAGAAGLRRARPIVTACRFRIARRAFATAGLTLLASVPPVAAACAAEDGGASFWLDFGKPVRLCPGARDPVPAKMVGQAWGILASGVLLCRDDGEAYAFSVEYLNVRVHPAERGSLKGERVRFEWLGLALFRSDARGGTDWLFDAARPIEGALNAEATGRIVFGGITFRVPKASAAPATNMLIYLTFGKPVVVVRVL